MQLTIDIWKLPLWELCFTFQNPAPSPVDLRFPSHPVIDKEFLQDTERDTATHMGRTVLQLGPREEEAIKLLRLSTAYEDEAVIYNMVEFLLMTTWPRPEKGHQGCWQKHKPYVVIHGSNLPVCEIHAPENTAPLDVLWQDVAYMPDHTAAGFDAVAAYDPNVLHQLLCTLALEGFRLREKHGIIS